MNFDVIYKIYSEMDGDYRNSREKCPECERNPGPKWKPWMGDLKQHLIQHYKVKYFLKYVSSNQNIL